MSKTHGVLNRSIWTNNVKINAIVCSSAKSTVETVCFGILPVIHSYFRHFLLWDHGLYIIRSGVCSSTSFSQIMDSLNQVSLREPITFNLIIFQYLQQLALPKVEQILSCVDTHSRSPKRPMSLAEILISTPQAPQEAWSGDAKCKAKAAG